MIRLRELLAGLTPCNGAYLTICVDGRGGSGKSALGDHLAALDGFEVVHGDDYFEPHNHPITWGDFNEERFDADVLSRLRAGDRHVPLRPYDFPHNRVGPERTLAPRDGIIIERCFSMALDVRWDLRLWVETPADECLRRGLARDAAGALGERARLAWQTVWQPAEDAYIAERRPVQTADLVIDGTRPYAEQMLFDVRGL